MVLTHSHVAGHCALGKRAVPSNNLAMTVHSGTLASALCIRSMWRPGHQEEKRAAQIAMRGFGTKAKITIKITPPQTARFLISSASMTPTCTKSGTHLSGVKGWQGASRLDEPLLALNYIIRRVLPRPKTGINTPYYKLECFRTSVAGPHDLSFPAMVRLCVYVGVFTRSRQGSNQNTET